MSAVSKKDILERLSLLTWTSWEQLQKDFEEQCGCAISKAQLYPSLKSLVISGRIRARLTWNLGESFGFQRCDENECGMVDDDSQDFLTHGHKCR